MFVVVLPVDVDRLRVGLDPEPISTSVTDPPTFSEGVQIPDHSPVRLHVLILGAAVIVSTQASDRVLIGAGQDDF